MLPCPSCDRHVRGDERACPFCTAPLRSSRGPWNGAAAIVIAVGSVLTACGPAVVDDGASLEASSSGSSSGSEGGEGSTGEDTTMSITGTTDPTMAMSSSTSLGTSSTGGSTTWDDDTADTACGFYGGCPGETGGVSYECDVFMQDCGASEKCSPWANDGGDVWNASRCTPFGAVPVGDPCTVEGSGSTGIDNCAPGAMCFYVDPETAEGVCVETCGGSSDEPTCLEGTCLLQFDGALPLCFETCDPKDPACVDGEVCEPALDAALTTNVCNPA